MRPAPIRVTGAAGLIGSHVCRALLNQDQLVVGIDNPISIVERSVSLSWQGYCFHAHCEHQRNPPNTNALAYI